MTTPTSASEAVVSYPREAVVTPRQVWTALQISRASYEKLDLPTVYLGTRTRRHIWGQVLDCLARRAA